MVDEETGEPSIKILSSCRNLISQLAALPVDSRNPEDVDTKAEDHLYDALRYMVMNRQTASSLYNFKFHTESAPKMEDSVFGY